ncbi:MAG: substrate-binding domain-containing protein, partial [Cyanobacteria bacterium P01_C01_bin.72]
RKPKQYPWRSLLILVLAILFGSFGYWWWHLQRQTSLANAIEPSICCIADVAGIPQGKFNYTAEKGGIWDYVWQQKNLVAKNITLNTKLAAKTPQFKLKYQPQTSTESAIARVKEEQADFAIVNSLTDIDSSLTSDTFAYDGLTFFVAFSQDRRNQDLLDSLKGKISLEQLRQLYTGKITNWQQLGGADLPVKLYIPNSDSAIVLFEEQVLIDRSQVEAFRHLLNTDKLDEQQITRRPILSMLRQILPEYENEHVGSIGFASLARVFNQCSVYPLAIESDRGKSFQPILQSNLEPIEPKLDLCREKGSYIRDRQIFQTNSYPLTYPLSIVYPRDNRQIPAGEKFAEMLKTDEAQKLLSKAGLIPLHN